MRRGKDNEQKSRRNSNKRKGRDERLKKQEKVRRYKMWRGTIKRRGKEI